MDTHCQENSTATKHSPHEASAEEEREMRIK